MSAVTISRQLGSFGDQIAEQVAGQLGYQLVERDLINQAARRAGAPEMALEVIDELGLLGVKPSLQAQEAYQVAVRQVIKELAASGNVVIVGRAGSVLLAGEPDLFHVRIIAPVAERIHRVGQAFAIPEGAARARIEASDQRRTEYLRRYHQVDWNASDLYDVVINTERFSVEMATELICLAFRRFTGSGDSAQNSPSAIQE
jgi:cytidylate kinase